MMTIPNPDAYYQYSDGRDMLSMTIMQRVNLLQELEGLAKAPQGKGATATITAFDLVRAQTLLYDLSVIGEIIDMLTVQINRYAGVIHKPRVEITEGKLQ